MFKKKKLLKKKSKCGKLNPGSWFHREGANILDWMKKGVLWKGTSAELSFCNIKKYNLISTNVVKIFYCRTGNTIEVNVLKIITFLVHYRKEKS